MITVLKTILSKLINDPDSLSVEEVNEFDKTFFTIRSSNENIPKIIGKNGATIKAINDLLYLYNQKTDSNSYNKFILKIEEALS